MVGGFRAIKDRLEEAYDDLFGADEMQTGSAKHNYSTGNNIERVVKDGELLN